MSKDPKTLYTSEQFDIALEHLADTLEELDRKLPDVAATARAKLAAILQPKQGPIQ